MNSAWLILVVGISVVVLVNLLLLLTPTTRGASSSRSSFVRRSRRAPSDDSAARSLVKGFAYLYGPASYSRQQRSVGTRMERVFGRIDTVDPYVAPRRIGNAMLTAGLAETVARRGPQPAGAEPAWPPPIDVPPAPPNPYLNAEPPTNHHGGVQ